MPLQDHLHLSAVLNEDTENAPSLQWKAFDRLLVPEVFLTVRRSLTAKMQTYVATNVNGPIQLSHLNYTLKVGADYGFTLAERIDQAKALQGRVVYLCDHFHSDNNTDHTPDVRRMFCKKVGSFAPVGPGLPYFRVDVELEDHSL